MVDNLRTAVGHGRLSHVIPRIRATAVRVERKGEDVALPYRIERDDRAIDAGEVMNLSAIAIVHARAIG